MILLVSRRQRIAHRGSCTNAGRSDMAEAALAAPAMDARTAIQPRFTVGVIHY